MSNPDTGIATDNRLCAGRIVLITGAGRGIGHEHALAFAAQGAKVMVNDLGAGVDGAGADRSAAQLVADEINASGGIALANADDVSTWSGAQRAVQATWDAFGGLDVVVNNAGILRDRMFVNMTEAEWDDVIAVHLKGSFAVTRHAVDYWRAQVKAGELVQGRVIMTSSPSGLFGNIGQANYGAAKAALAGLTIILADELARLGVTVNAIAPVALTRMTEGLPGFVDAAKKALEETGFNPFDPMHIAPLVVWLGSTASAEITGRVFTVMGGEVGVAEPWVKGPTITSTEPWDPSAFTDTIPALVASARGNSDMSGRTRE
jgi:NAD(P)-dependent dehydrogenase (short-subunit alcohol dehydrogenase family)